MYHNNMSMGNCAGSMACTNWMGRSVYHAPHGDTVFGQIIRRESPATIIYEDAQCIAFYDIAPVAPVHFLVVPKKPIPCLAATEDTDDWLLGHMMIVARRLARELGLSKGYRIVINNGPQACQTVYHLHLHVAGGRQLRWPPY